MTRTPVILLTSGVTVNGMLAARAARKQSRRFWVLFVTTRIKTLHGSDARRKIPSFPALGIETCAKQRFDRRRNYTMQAGTIHKHKWFVRNRVSFRTLYTFIIEAVSLFYSFAKEHHSLFPFPWTLHEGVGEIYLLFCS